MVRSTTRRTTYWRALNVRVPNHYDMPIQPVDFIIENNMGFVEGCIVKYICRYDMKGGVEDLEKIKNYCDILIHSAKSKS